MASAIFLFLVDIAKPKAYQGGGGNWLHLGRNFANEAKKQCDDSVNMTKMSVIPTFETRIVTNAQKFTWLTLYNFKKSYYHQYVEKLTFQMHCCVTKIIILQFLYNEKYAPLYAIGWSNTHVYSVIYNIRHFLIIIFPF